MKKIIAALVFSSAACATTARTTTPDSPGTGMMPSLDMSSARGDNADAWFPALASEASLPSVANYQRELSTDRDRYDLAVRLCVAPNGSVASVELTQASGSERLDRAVEHDIAAWQFAAFSAPSHIRVCKPLAFGYEPAAEASHLRIPLVRLSSRE
ncbi:MAG TPA: TonB family protein [Kofleriaceae bacterium]|nr:TonB family protein [Kofleriaceae bacterium]